MKYLLLLLTMSHFFIACSKEVPGQRVDPHSALGRRERMEERMEEKLKEHKIFPMNPAEGKDPRQDSK